MDQLKKGIFTTIYNLVNEMGTLILKENRVFLNIVKLEGKSIENYEAQFILYAHTSIII